jgi:hypothetical protein
MAELNARIIAKASGTASEEPLAADLEVAELAVNTADGKLFTKHTDGSVVTISGGGGGGAVDSVNGETGVVDLSLFDIADVGNKYSSSVGVWSQTSTSGSGVINGGSRPVNAGEWAYSGTELRLYGSADSTTPDWTERQDPPGSLWIKVDGGVYQEQAFTSSRYFSEAVDGWYGFTMPNFGLVGGEALDVSFSAPTTIAAPIDGQVLSWDEVAGEWRPATLPAVIDQATLKAEVAASTDFADFQSRIAAL